MESIQDIKGKKLAVNWYVQSSTFVQNWNDTEIHITEHRNFLDRNKPGKINKQTNINYVYF